MLSPGHPAPAPPCAHCPAAPGAGRLRRGLCDRCYRQPSIRALFAARRPWTAEPPEPPRDALPVPTRHWPGTAGKVAVLELRRARGQQLWNHYDARLDQDAPSSADQSGSAFLRAFRAA